MPEQFADDIAMDAEKIAARFKALAYELMAQHNDKALALSIFDVGAALALFEISDEFGMARGQRFGILIRQFFGASQLPGAAMAHPQGRA